MLTARGGRKIYTSIIEIMRTSGVLDVIPIQVPEELAGEIWESCRRQNHALWRIPIIQ